MKSLRRGKSAIAVVLALSTIFVVIIPSNELQGGFQSLTTAVPAVSRPPTQSCVVTLAKHRSFSAGETPFLANYSSPSRCLPPWSKVVLDLWGSVDGQQTDRVIGIWVGRVEIFRGTTPFTDPSGIAWHVDKDVTEYSSTLGKDQTVTIIVPNYLSSGADGRIYVSVDLTFYETGAQYPASSAPDVAIPLASGQQAPWFTTTNASFRLRSNLTLPPQTSKLILEIYATPHSPCDEFWYAPDLTPCGGSPFREIRTFIDGLLVGVMLPLPIMYSGALNPALWKPVPSIDSLNIPPKSVDLTPFLGVLVNDESHNITLQIQNYHDRWRVDGSLLCYLDYASSTISGSLDEYDVASGPALSHTQLSVGTDEVTTTLAQRQIIVSGTVQTSTGNVTTVTTEKESFNNTTVFDLIFSGETIYQSEIETTNITTIGTAGIEVRMIQLAYLMRAAFNVILYATLTHVLGASVSESLDRASTIEMNGAMSSSSDLVDSVDASTLGPYWTVEGEKTTEDFLYREATISCSSCETLIRTTASGDRTNVGLTGLEFVSLLSVICSIEFVARKRKAGAEMLFDVGVITSLISVLFVYSKYTVLAGYKFGILSLAFGLSPELAALAGGIFLLSIGRRLYGQERRLDKKSPT